MQGVYFNEFDSYPAQWLRNLYPDHAVDERSIADVKPDDVRGFQRAHFFAGIGCWEHALQLAGWPRAIPVWTGSCPCQPFSNAGKRKAESDERHLWPEFRRLIAECRPSVVFGEQVVSKLGRDWLSGVQADLEALGFAFGAADLCAAGIAAPHIRQRLFWVAYSQVERERESRRVLPAESVGRQARNDASERRGAGWIPDSTSERREWRQGAESGSESDREVTGRRQGDDGPVGIHEIGAGRLWQSSVDRDGALSHQGSADKGEGEWRLHCGGRSGAVGRSGEPNRQGLSQRISEPRYDGEEFTTSERASNDAGGVVLADVDGRESRRPAGETAGHRSSPEPAGGSIGMAYCLCERNENSQSTETQGADGGVQGAARKRERLWVDPWERHDLVYCLDGKTRGIESGIQCLVDGDTFRLADGRSRQDCSRAKILKCIGNAIVPQVAAQFIRAFMGSVGIEPEYAE